MVNMDLTPEERAGLDALLSDEDRTGDDIQDLAKAARVAMQRRVENSQRGGIVLGALNRAVSWRQVERLTGIPESTARRWASPPPTAEQITESGDVIRLKKSAPISAAPKPPANTSTELLSTGPAAEAVGATRAALTKWMREGLITPTERVGKRGDARWNLDDLKRQMAEKKLSGRQ